MKCSGCVATMERVLNGNKEIKKWAADITVPEKFLTIETETLEAEELIEIIKKAGFQAARING